MDLRPSETTYVDHHVVPDVVEEHRWSVLRVSWVLEVVSVEPERQETRIRDPIP